MICAHLSGTEVEFSILQGDHERPIYKLQLLDIGSPPGWLWVAECSVYKPSSKIIGNQNRVTELLNQQHCCPFLSLQNLHGKFIATDYEQRRMPRNPPW